MAAIELHTIQYVLPAYMVYNNRRLMFDVISILQQGYAARSRLATV